MMKKEYESPKAEFFRVEGSVLCNDSVFGWEQEEELPYG